MKMKTVRKTVKLVTLALVLLLHIAASSCIAQGYSIDWYSINGGGGTSTGGVYTVSGSIGQPDAGAMSGGNYSLTGGFWSLISAVQTAGAPTLFIRRSGAQVTVYWQNTASWTLQQNTSLGAPTAWSASGGVTTSNGTNYLNLLNPTGNLFFRLR